MKGSAVAGVAGTQMHERRSLTAYSHVFESCLGFEPAYKMALAKSQNAPYKTVRPKLNVSQNKSLILFTQGTPTPSEPTFRQVVITTEWKRLNEVSMPLRVGVGLSALAPGSSSNF